MSDCAPKRTTCVLRPIIK